MLIEMWIEQFPDMMCNGCLTMLLVICVVFVAYKLFMWFFGFDNIPNVGERYPTEKGDNKNYERPNGLKVE